MKKKILVALLTTCMVFSLVACGEENEGGQTEGSKFETLNVGTMALTMGIPVLYAEEQGYFEEVGLDVNVELFATGAPINEAIAAEQLDIAVSGFASVYSLANANCIWLADVNTSGGNGLYAREDSEIANAGEKDGLIGSAEALEGIMILEPLGTVVQYMTESYAEKFGLSPEDISQVNMEYASAYQAFTTGEGDAMAAVPPYSYLLEDEGYVKLCSFEDATGVSLCVGVFARDVIVEERSEEVQLFIDCLIKAMDDLQDEALRAEYTKKVYTDNAIEHTDEGVAQEIADRDYVGTEMISSTDYKLGAAWVAITDFLVDAEKIIEENGPNVEKSINTDFITNVK